LSGVLEAEALRTTNDRQVFWLTAGNGLHPPSHDSAVAVACWAHPRRIQRRPRDGFAPSSLFSPAATCVRSRGTCRFPSHYRPLGCPVNRALQLPGS